MEADFYLEKMLDISRLDPCDSSVDFWNSDTLNELVYYDSKVYVKLGMGDVAGAEQAAVDMQAILTEREIPERWQSLFPASEGIYGLVSSPLPAKRQGGHCGRI